MLTWVIIGGIVILVIVFCFSKADDWVEGVMYCLLAVCIALVGAMCYFGYMEVKAHIDEKAYCRARMENGSKGFELTILDKYTYTETTMVYSGKVLIPITDTYYCVVYKWNEVGDDVYTIKKENVSLNLYYYYEVGKKYHNNCTFLTKDSVNDSTNVKK